MNAPEAINQENDNLLSIEEIAEGFYLASVVRGLYRIGVIQALQSSTSASKLSKHFQIDEDLLAGSLDYLVARSNLLIRDSENYRLRVNLEQLHYFVCQYLEAYGPAVLRLDTVMADPATALSFVKFDAHSQAFSNQTRSSIPALPKLIRRFKCQSLLDLGCGAGSLLIALAEAIDEFVGWGVDLNPAMCAQAQTKINDKGFADRIFIHCADATQINELSSLPINFDEIQSVSMSSLLNELLYPGTEKAADFLAELRLLIPGRIAFVADYYGRLGSSLKGCSHGLLHDYVQLLTGQGIPPHTCEEWQYIYRQADCQLIHAYESSEQGEIAYFIHLLKL